MSIADDFRRGPQRRIDVGHSRLAYWRFGSGPDLVFVHGWPLSGATFRRIIPMLQDDFTCHVLDLPGTGHTETGPDAPIGLVAHAATVRAAIDALGLSSYALVAHDSGGFVARVLAAGDARVRGLALGNTEIPGHTPWLVTLYAMIARLPGGARLVRTLLRSRALLRSSLGFRGCFVDPRYVDGEFRELFVEPILRSPRVAADQIRLLQAVTSSEMASLRDVHGKIRAPVQLIWGTDDPFFPLEKARRMLPQLAGPARLDEIAGAKLFAHEDRPDDFAALARPFLRSCFAS
jgi:pimeloyl-ACP methyl ester carboxylesterase